MKLLVETLSKKQIPLDVDTNCTIKDIKAKIQDIEGIEPDNQRLMFNNQQLEDEITLNNYSIVENSIIILIIQLGMYILIEMPDGKKIKLETKPIQRIGDIKEEIDHKIGIPLKDKKLFYNGHELEDENRLLDYSIESKSILQLSHT